MVSYAGAVQPEGFPAVMDVCFVNQDVVMDPFVIITVVLTVFIFAGYMGKKGMDLEKMKLQAKYGSGDKSLGASELKGLIRQAVEEANAPLQQRILELEAKLDKLDGARSLIAPRMRELSPGRTDSER